MAKPVFTNFDFLDPFSAAKKLATAGLSVSSLNFSLLDPTLAAAEINAASGSTPKPFNNYRGIYDTRWTPGTNADGVDWSLANAIGSL